MIAETPFIFYSLPKSRTTQQLINGRKIEKAWARVCDFLNNCTTVNPDQPSGINLTAYSAYKGDVNSEIADKIIAQAKLLFGEGQTDPISYSYPSGLPDEHTKTEWRLNKNDLNKVLKYLIEGQPWPKYTFGPVELTISYNFKLIYPTDRKELANQELSSSIMIWLSQSCLCSPDIYFPFRQPNLEFYNYFKEIENFLPFKLEQKYLRIGRTKREAIVFFEFLGRFNKNDDLSRFEDQAEQRVLWDIECILEKKLNEPFRADYHEIVKKAREAVRDEKE